MSKKDKELKAIRNNPKNVRFEVIQRIMLRYGFSENISSHGSSHYTYRKGELRVTIVRENPVKTYYIKDAIAILDESKEVTITALDESENNTVATLDESEKDAVETVDESEVER